MISRNSYIQNYVKLDAKWYERDGLLTRIDEIHYKNFIENRTDYINNTNLINFNIIHHRCRGDKLEKTIKDYNTVDNSHLKYQPSEDKFQSVAACFRSTNKNINVDETVAVNYFNTYKDNFSKSKFIKEKGHLIKLKNLKYYAEW